jgi:hypothetical protein
MRYLTISTRFFFTLLFAICLLNNTSWAADLHAQEEARCLCCHSCPNPTRNNKCLRTCERSPEVAEITASISGVADIIYLDELVGLYAPVSFPHKLHADMENMGTGCAVCHHHNPPGRIFACNECHGGPSNPANLGQPGLKGAYHRQCLGCHREWSHKTNCDACHIKRDAAPAVLGATQAVSAERLAAQVTSASGEDTTDIMGRLHPNIETPEKWVYKTEDNSEGPVVTFHHKEHTEVFGLKCTDCHKKENCSRCHDPQSHPPHVREDPHQDCIKCHDVSDNCTICHTQQETPTFDHARRSGFVLKGYHQKVSCMKCHTGGMPFKKLDPQCTGCHGADFTPKDFDHAKAGVILDDTHKEGSCNDCHTEGFGKPAACAGCHDDGRKFPASVPGKVVE